MVKEKEFDIPFSGLKIGMHRFTFEIDDTFFDLFNFTDLKNSAIKVIIDLDKKVNLLNVNYHIQGQLTLSCDICSDDYNQPINQHFDQIVKISDWHNENTNDEIIYLSRQEHTLSVSKSIYEFVRLSLPTKRSHSSEAECNQEMITRLEQYRIKQKKEVSDNIDPRWAKLTELKN